MSATVRIILAGQTATFATGDGTGWHRRPAPADGLLIEDDSTTVFVAEHDVRQRLQELVTTRALIAKRAAKGGAR